MLYFGARSAKKTAYLSNSGYLNGGSKLYQLEVLEGMEASMRTTFYTTKRKEMATQMMATPSAGTSFEDPIYLGEF